MNSTRGLPVPAADLQRLVRQAWLDLKQARRDNAMDRILRSERRMNALLDQLYTRKLTAVDQRAGSHARAGNHIRT